ncbi:DUF6049 family protein [Agromyces aerolatus]|uniref:DUF6049 family protein n=1 Tax=Agromyces sp. LY-1074 TaxID=3074080 RepID=UPI002866F4A1|nr:MULTISPECIES: DUF6049 family protein [unclassified Agromyces]MDR5699317.1 DUF6049 family protein [Agromyces sp. LY-1074]MDR5705613.1 DUF6049 family protein [Agromyces sp. LY-1358]
MLAESSPVRRLRRHFTGRRGLGLAAVGLVSAILAAPVVANAGGLPDALGSITGTDASAARTATAAAAPAPEADAVVALSIAPTIGTTIDPAGVVTLEVEIDNRTGGALAAGHVRLTRAAAPIADQSALDAWIGAATAEERDRPPSEQVAEVATRALPAGVSEVVSFTLPAGALGDTAGAAVIGLGAEYAADDATTAITSGAFATSAGIGPGPQLAMAYALTVPAETEGLIDADDLELWTGPTGLLTRQLDAVADRAVAIALDPRLVASIRALGTSAPDSAVSWLERLAGVSNEVFPLAYADADLAAQTQLGLEPLAPISFTDVLDPADFAGETGDDGDDGESDGVVADGIAQQSADGDEDGDERRTDAAPAATDQPTEPAVPSQVPTTEQLLAWPYTRTDLAWPADATVASGDLAAFRAAGYSTTILSASNVDAGDLDRNAASTVDGESAVMADARFTDALREAAAARSDVAWGEAASRLGAELAMRAGTTDAVLLATFQRGAATQSARVSATLDAIASWPWSNPTSLSDAIGAPPVERGLVDAPENPERLGQLSRLLESETAVQEFATVLDDETLLTAPARRQLLALFDVAWIPQPAEWSAAVGERLATQSATVDAVSVAQSSPVNVLSSETGVPTTVENLLPYPVTVFVDVAPSNGRLIVEERVETTVAADSRSNVIVPVAAGVGNGEVTLSVSLWSRDGVKVGQTVQIPANVQADWEGLGALILGVVVVVFFGVGIWRNIRRRRRERAADASATDAREPADGDPTDDSAEPADPAEPPQPADVGGSQYSEPHAASIDGTTDIDSEGPRRDG